MAIKHALFQSLATLLIIFSVKLALAVVPSAMNYQGHLTDSSSVPIDGPVTMVFAIYDVEIGGTALWSESQAVTVSQGVFSVELGGISPFPPGLEAPLWLGLTVDTDAEMTPRRPFSSVGFAFKASDADAVEGMSASTLDQSAHVIDTANPHNVTAAQTGAADAATLSAHTSDTSNPHSVTAAQAGAADLTDYILHALNPGAHHLRYTDSEALTAMGVINDGNPLNHNKYTDANVVTAMLANDGAGSTLDSDKVDGLEASELIDAAQDEVRTPISSLPYTISQPGSYYLTGNLDGSSGGIDIIVDNVTLDLMGFTIDGGMTINDYGINFGGQSNVTIKNGYVINFGLAGIFQNHPSHFNAYIFDMQVLGNGTLGTTFQHSGIYLGGRLSHVERSAAGNNGGYGITASVGAKLISNTAYGNSGYGISGSTDCIITGNVSYNNNGNGIYGEHCTIRNNVAYDNTGTYGIGGLSSSVVSGNTVTSHSGSYAIFGGNSVISDNTAYANNTTYGIGGGIGAIIRGNTSYANQRWGIYASNSNLIESNVVYDNNNSNTANEGGLRVGSDSRVVGNTLDNNLQNNIYVYGDDNYIKDNLVADSTNGINFRIGGNFFDENVAHGNTNSWVNNTSQTSGGSNWGL